MRKIIGLFLLLTMIFTGCDRELKMEDSETPPELTINANNKSITAVRGTYSWRNVVADSEAPPELVKHQEENLSVKPQSFITLKFDKLPDDYKVTIWQGNNQIAQQISNGSLIAPQQKGLVVYEVYASWKDGNSYYAFSVNVGL
jgi:hypothetical protein